MCDGGHPATVVHENASVWYYFRELDYPNTKYLWAVGDSIAQGAAMMTGTTLEPDRVLGSAWAQYFSKPIAEAMAANIKAVGMPHGNEDDQGFATALPTQLN